MSAAQQLIVGAVGEYNDVGASFLQAFQNANMNPVARVALQRSIAQKIANAQARLQQQAPPQLAPLAQALGKQGAIIHRLGQNALDSAFKLKFYRAQFGDSATGICFDNVAPFSLSGIATITGPYGRPWRILDLAALDSDVSNWRMVSFKFSNLEQVNVSNVAYSAGAPTNPGLGLSLFVTTATSNPTRMLTPWARDPRWVDSTFPLAIQVYNNSPQTRSLELVLVHQTNPCPDRPGKDVLGVSRSPQSIGSFYGAYED